MKYQTLSDDYIEKLFEGTNFGEPINRSTELKRMAIKKSLQDQIKGLWAGKTMYSILVDGGFLIDSKSCTNKKLTELGHAFLNEQKPYQISHEL